MAEKNEESKNVRPLECPPPQGRLRSTLYGRAVTDCIVRIAEAIAIHYVDNATLYSNLDDEQRLTNFQTLIGSNPEWPNSIQRQAIYKGLFGPSDDRAGVDRSSRFHQRAIALRERAAKFSERVYDTGEEQLRQAFRDEVLTMRAYLISIKGKVVDEGNRRTKTIYDAAVGVLHDQGVAQVFGLKPAPDLPWPLDLNLDGNAEYLIERITHTLELENTDFVTHFVFLQRIAFYGMQTIAGVLDDSKGWDDNNRIDCLIRSAYSWETALTALEATGEQLYSEKMVYDK